MSISAVNSVPAMLDAIERDLDGLRKPTSKDVEWLLTREVEALLLIIRGDSREPYGKERNGHIAAFTAMSAADDCVHIVMRLVNGDKNPIAVARELAKALPLLRRAWWAQVAESSGPHYASLA